MKSFGRKLSHHAAYIAKTLKLDAAAVVSIKDKKINFYFGSEKECTEDEMKEILQECIKGLHKVIDGIHNGTVEKVEVPQEEEEAEEESQQSWGCN